MSGLHGEPADLGVAEHTPWQHAVEQLGITHHVLVHSKSIKQAEPAGTVPFMTGVQVGSATAAAAALAWPLSVHGKAVIPPEQAPGLFGTNWIRPALMASCTVAMGLFMKRAVALGVGDPLQIRGGTARTGASASRHPASAPKRAAAPASGNAHATRPAKRAASNTART